MYANCTGHVGNLSMQCREWEKTLDVVQHARTKERQKYEQVITYKVIYDSDECYSLTIRFHVNITQVDMIPL